MNKIFLLLTILFAKSIYSQLPNTDIWLLDIVKIKDSISLKNPTNITNRIGYDNQPVFSPDGKYILYTSIRDDKQADIYKYDLSKKSISQFTHTATSEYSPTFMPDGKNISVVMVEPDSTQRLWQFPINGGSPSLIMKGIDSIGYHCWLDKNNIALVMITEPPSLELVNIVTEKVNMIAKNVGRCMFSPKEGLLNYVQKKDSTTNYLSFYDRKTNAGKDDIFELPNEDFAFLKTTENIIFTGMKSKIMASYYLQKTNKCILDLSNLGIKIITRIAINKQGTQMAIVAE